MYAACGPSAICTQVEVALGDKSTLTQEIMLDADGQYLEFKTKVYLLSTAASFWVIKILRMVISVLAPF